MKAELVTVPEPPNPLVPVLFKPKAIFEQGVTAGDAVDVKVAVEVRVGEAVCTVVKVGVGEVVIV